MPFTAVQPIHGYDGFQANDTAQLDAMISVIKQFVDGGVTVWLRFAHEMNWSEIPLIHTCSSAG